MATMDTLRSQPVPQPFFSPFIRSSPSILGRSNKRKFSDISTSRPLAQPYSMAQTTSKASFDASRHINHVEPSKIYTMEEIGLADQGISANAISVPFPLFTEEAIKEMRAEILSKDVLRNCQYSSNIAAAQLRGFAAKYAPFVYEAWNSPEVLQIVSKIAGIELVPVMDFEVGHVNLSINLDTGEQTDIAKTRDQSAGKDDEKPIVGWHTDSYPFVCVLMLSDCTNMVGGETAIRTGSGEVMKVRGPGMGNAVILQGRYIEHQALRALGGTERITMVTSFRPKSAMVRDDTVLTTVRSVSDLSLLYSQYSEYRLENLEERVRKQLKTVRERSQANKKFDTAGVKTFLMEQRSFIDSMLTQLVNDEKVVKGIMEDTGVVSKDLIEEANKNIKMYVDN